MGVACMHSKNACMHVYVYLYARVLSPSTKRGLRNPTANRANVCMYGCVYVLCMDKGTNLPNSLVACTRNYVVDVCM